MPPRSRAAAMLTSTACLTAVLAVLPAMSASADAALEMESAALTTGAGTTYADSTASAARALLIWSNGTASAAWATPTTTHVVVRARGDQCKGAPRLELRVDGVSQSTTSVSATSWTDYVTAVQLPSGTHQISVTYSNDYRANRCDRNLRVDRITAIAASTASPSPSTSPSPSPSASPVTSPSATTSVSPTTSPSATTSPSPTTSVSPTTSPSATTSPSPTTSVSPTTSPSPDSGSVNVLSGARLYVDPASSAAHAAAGLRSTDPTRAALLDKIAGQSQADWIGDWVAASELATVVDRRVDAITAAGALPVLVAYAIPSRDCGGYSAGGIGTPEGYRTWVREFAKGLGGRRSVVVLEPDSLASISCLSAEMQQTRLALLTDAVAVLTASGAQVYLDAGHSAWVPVETMAARLTAAGISGARGFALNVSNFRLTSDEVSYGRSLSQRLNGKSFVVDTSRNGLGPASGTDAWCNPSGRALGVRPNVATQLVEVDAYLWIKRPGESDGTCNGGPTAGAWWTDYAVGLSERAAW